MSLRTLVYDTLKVDAQLIALGIDEDSLYPNFSADSPAADQQRWVVLRWGVVEPPFAPQVPVRPQTLTLWAYDRERDFAAIAAILRRCRTLLTDLSAVWTGDGHLLEIQQTGSSEDLWDDGYQAVTRNEAYRMVASGT